MSYLHQHLQCTVFSVHPGAFALLMGCNACSTWKTYRLSKGPKYARERKKQATVLTADMLAKWVHLARSCMSWHPADLCSQQIGNLHMYHQLNCRFGAVGL